MLFEDVWVQKGKVYTREYDPVLKKSYSRLTKYKAEYYLEDALGKYNSLLDPKTKLRKVFGSAYNVQGAYGVKRGDYVLLREEYFGSGFNKDPRVWHLDIETSVGLNSKGFPHAKDALEEITLIQFWDTIEKKGYVLGQEPWYYENDYSYPFDVEYINCGNERGIIDKYIELFKEKDPLIITAWSGNNFDF